MSASLHLPVIVAVAFVAAGSPGPATLAIADNAMRSGRRFGLAVASGIMTVSLMWSTAAAFGLGALMLANAWAFEAARYLGASYLLYLAVISARAAMSDADPAPARGTETAPSLARAYRKGLAVHLTNPKPMLFFGSLYSIGVPAGATPVDLLTVILSVGAASGLVFHGYALAFSSAPMVRLYMRLRRWFQAVFALAFAAAGVKILTSRI
jgi:threonine efflux protein